MHMNLIIFNQTNRTNLKLDRNRVKWGRRLPKIGAYTATDQTFIVKIIANSYNLSPKLKEPAHS